MHKSKMLLDRSFVLEPSKLHPGKVMDLRYTGIKLRAVKRRLYQDPSPATSAAVIQTRTSSLSSDGLPKIKRRRLPPIPLHRDNVVESSIALAFLPPTQNYREKAQFWQKLARQQKQQIRELEMDAKQLRRRLWELEEQVVLVSSAPQGHRRPLARANSTAAAQPISPSTNHSEKPPSYIVTMPRKCCFYLTDGEALSEDEYDDSDHCDEECDHCCGGEDEENQGKDNNSSSGGNDTGAAQLFRVKQEAREEEDAGR